MSNNRLSPFRRLLRDNHGDSYMSMLGMLTAILLLGAVMFSVVSITINMTSVRHEIDTAAENVFSQIRAECYDNIIQGRLDNTVPSYTSAQLMQMISLNLSSGKSEVEYPEEGQTEIRNYSGSGKLAFTVSNLMYRYFDKANASGEYFKPGDINHDGSVDGTDLSLLTDYINSAAAGETTPGGFYTNEANLNNDISDGIPILDQSDVKLMNALIDYYDSQSDSSAASSTSLLVMIVDVSIPLDFGNIHGGTASNSYAYVMPLSFKPVTQ